MPGFTSDDTGYLLYYLIISAVVAAGVVSLYWGRPGRALRDAALWLLFILVILIGYALRDELRFVGQRVLGVLVPGYAFTSADGEAIEIAAGADGHFAVRGAVNGVPVTFLADTGASAVVLAYEDAERIGIDPGGLSYTVPVVTANGTAMAARLNLHEVSVGSIARENVSGFVAQPGRLDGSLLGMSFLGRLSSIELKGSRLILRD
ncbi:MAG TPA: TIGR02281 family clan AA aspartic protease [Aestuariivirgaceae bacterium]|nr:TIGR02281 family clan AA aspartic protease [Aestuariivirgaceae bacterium]